LEFNSLFSQITFSKGYGGPYDEQVNAIEMTDDGG
jgi:hypothetical protein